MVKPNGEKRAYKKFYGNIPDYKQYLKNFE